jgi:hypothetical protein
MSGVDLSYYLPKYLMGNKIGSLSILINIISFLELSTSYETFSLCAAHKCPHTNLEGGVGGNPKKRTLRLHCGSFQCHSKGMAIIL